tara:strand:- start:2674 stop:4764 length:2091 start_codon:yes stop_codon:yes gene_type:complete
MNNTLTKETPVILSKDIDKFGSLKEKLVEPKFDKNKAPLHITSNRFINNAEELAEWLSKKYDKYIKYVDDNQIVDIKINVSKEAYFTLFRTRKNNSKILVDFYKSKAWGFFIQNHIANRLWNNSRDGRMTQLRLVLEGMIGIANIGNAPGGFTKREDGCGVLSIIDKGNWTVWQNLAFEFTEPSNDMSIPKFNASELTDVLTNSQLYNTAPIIRELIDRIEYTGVLTRMTLKQWFKEIDRYDLIVNYLNSPFTLSILVGPEELYLKEMIDENNIYNLWCSINFFLSRWQKDGTGDIDLFNLLDKVYNKDSIKWKTIRRVLTGEKPGTTLLKNVRSLSKSCREFALFPSIALEIVRKNTQFENKDVYKLFDNYAKIDKNKGIDDNPLMKAYTNYMYNQNCNLDLEKSYDFIYKFFDETDNSKVKDNCKKIENIFKKLSTNIKEMENDKLCNTNTNSIGFSNKSQEDFQFMILSMIYNIVSKKQTIKTEHISHILSTMYKKIKGCFSVNKKTNDIVGDDTKLGKTMRDLIEVGHGSYAWKSNFIESLSEELEKDFEISFGKNTKNNTFKKKEIQNLSYLKTQAGFADAKLKFVFINKKGHIETFDEDSFMSMDWRHIESGKDLYPNGVLWLSDPNRQYGMMDDMHITNKKESYTKLYMWMSKNQKKYGSKILKMDLVCWENILNEWDNHFDDNLKSIG